MIRDTVPSEMEIPQHVQFGVNSRRPRGGLTATIRSINRRISTAVASRPDDGDGISTIALKNCGPVPVASA